MSDFDSYVAKNVSGSYVDFIRKRVSNVTHRNGIYTIEFGDSLVGQGVVIPDSLGFEPVKNMQAIWDADDSMGSVGDLSFYDETGKLLSSMHREQETKKHKSWKDTWSNTTPEPTQRKHELTKEQLIKMIPTLSVEEYAAMSADIHRLLSPQEIAKYSTLDQMCAMSERDLTTLQSIQRETPKNTHAPVKSGQEDLVPKDFLPISRVMFRALSENCGNDNARKRVVEYLTEVQKLWQSLTAKRDLADWHWYLVEAYQKMEKEGIITHEGVIQKPQELAKGKFLTPMCRPAGSMPIELKETNEFRKLATQKASRVDTIQK